MGPITAIERSDLDKGSRFISFFNNTSVVISKKLELISYFSKKTDVIPKELMSFLFKGIKENVISLESLTKYDFYEKLLSFFLIHLIKSL